MKVFISWSGQQSRQIAEALHEWLPAVLQAVKPYMSHKDNDAGGLWDHIITSELESTNCGLVCLTPDNLESRWIHFEAGALSKAVMDQSRVVPLLFNLETADVSLPLARFQMKRLDEQGVLETLESINKSLVENQLSENHLRTVFDAMWPSLKAKLDAVPRGEQPPQRPDRELLEEILSVLRRMSNLSAASRFVNPGDTVFFPRWYAKASDTGAVNELMARVRTLAGPEGVVEIAGSEVLVRLSPREFTHADVVEVTDLQREFANYGLTLRTTT